MATDRVRAAPSPAPVLLLAAVVSAVLAGCTSAGSAPSPVTPPASATTALGPPYVSPDGYRISPPAGWLRYPLPPPPGTSISFTATDLDRASSKPFADTLSVTVTPTGQSLADVVAAANDRFKALPLNYRVVSDQPVQLADGQPAHLLGSTFGHPSFGSRHAIQLLTVRAGKSYVVTFTAAAGSYDAVDALFRRSLSSFAAQ